MSESRQIIFAIWAPQSGAWSAWVKPALFSFIGQWSASDAQLSQATPSFAPTLTEQIPAANRRSAIIIDLPGVLSINTAIALAATRGYRPVTLFNAVPGSLGGQAVRSAIEVWPIVHALESASSSLQAILPSLSVDTPPAFLLDANRRGAMHRPLPGTFDNRSISLPSDFPSANLLRSRGIERVIVIQPTTGQPQADLRHTLLRWQQAGIAIFVSSIDSEDALTQPTLMRIARPSWFASMFYNLVALAGLRRSPLGGFGGVLPAYSSSG